MIQADSVHSTPRINSPIGGPADTAGALYFPTDISPEEIFQAIGRLRQEAQDEIERLLAFLDRTEPDPDLEPYLAGFQPGMDDREGMSGDDEPSRGWAERINQATGG